MFRGGGDIQESKIAWRRSSVGEAFSTTCHVFTITMVLHVLWHLIAGGAATYERAFFYSSCFGVGYGFASLFFKTKMVVLR